MSEATEIRPRRGLRFLHHRFINDDKSPKEMVITSVTATAVYYTTAVSWDLGDHKGFLRISRAKFPGIMTRVVEEGQ